jgi:hypothetical protein
MNDIGDWNERLQRCRERMRLKRKWEQRLKELDKRRAELAESAERHAETLRREEQDVGRLEKLSLSRFFHTVLGTIETKLQEEKREALEAKLKYDAAAASLQAAERERAEAEARLADVSGADAEYERLIREKESWMLSSGSDAADALHELSGEIGERRAEGKELREALAAGRRALDALERAEERLSSARNWGTYDMLGGGMIATAIKRGRIEEATEHIHEAQQSLARFERELRDLGGASRVDGVEIGGFLGFADFFFDGFLTDWIVQGKINDCLATVRQRLDDVRRLLAKLSEQADANERSLEALGERYRRTVEQYGA